MPKSIRKPLRASGGNLVVLPVRFYPDTANNPSTIVDPGNIVASIVHSADGKYTITFNETFAEIVNVVCSMSVVGDSTDATAQGGVEDEAAGTVVVKTKAGATNTDFAADANTHVNLLLTIREVAVP